MIVLSNKAVKYIRFDLSLTDYYAWTTFHDPYYKPDEYSEIVVCKIYLSPKWLIHAFGMGMDPWRNRLATKEFDFEDSNLDKFCLYNSYINIQGMMQNKQLNIGDPTDQNNFITNNNI